MKRIAFLFAVVAVAGVAVFTVAAAAGDSDGEAVPIFGIKIPPGYRDWRLVSVAHEAGNLNDIRAILGNDSAIKAYRGREASVPGRRDHRPNCLELRAVGGKQQSLWPRPIFCAGAAPDGTCSLW